MQQCFAQISDPHVSSLEQVRARDLCNKRALGYLSWRRKRRFEHRPEVLAALARDLHASHYDQLLVTGDLTHIGLPQEFRQAADWLQTLGKPQDVAVIPGNHDSCVAAPYEDTYALWRDYMAADGSATESALSEGLSKGPSLRIRGGIAFIGLSSGCPKLPLMATGTVSEDQLQALPKILNETALQGLFRVVHIHHCPLPGVEKWRKRLTNAAVLSEILRSHGAELALHGHGHRAHYNELKTRAGTLPVIAVPSASALGLHGADIAAYNRYQVQRTEHGWNLDIEQRKYSPGSNSFGAGESRQLEISRH